MLMKRFLPILCAIVLSVAPVGAKNPAKNAVKAALPASSEKITFIGRTLPVDGAVSFDWSGVTAVVCTIQKRNEGRQGRLTFKGLCTDGEFLQARSLKDRKIEAIGDSYTCGYGTEGKDRSEGFKLRPRIAT